MVIDRSYYTHLAGDFEQGHPKAQNPKVRAESAIHSAFIIQPSAFQIDSAALRLGKLIHTKRFNRPGALPYTSPP